MNHNKLMKWIVGASSVTLLALIGYGVQSNPHVQHTFNNPFTQQSDDFGFEFEEGFERHEHHHERGQFDDQNQQGQMQQSQMRSQAS